MKKFLNILCILVLSTGCWVAAKPAQPEPGRALHCVEQWFSAWEMLSKETFNVHTIWPVDFVFFDDTYIYSTSSISVPGGALIPGPTLFKKNLTWRKQRHDGKIKLPDNKMVPIGLMSFASPINDTCSFFVMPLLSFWQNANVKSDEIPLTLLVTGVFLHEFAHSQQMQNFGKKMTEYDNNHKFKFEFSDDIVQDYFETDSLYEKAFRSEVQIFYEAAAAANPQRVVELYKQGLNRCRSRQATYFINDETVFNGIDDFFLTMEGFGQYAMYTWLVHPDGGNITAAVSLKAVRRGGRSWSQEEGLAVFLILSKLASPEQWASLLVGKETISVFDLIEYYLPRNK